MATEKRARGKGKAVKQDDFKAYLQETEGHERDYLQEVARSRRNAWRVAVAGVLVGLVGFGFGVYGNHRAQPAPAVLRVDSTTGAVDVLSTLPVTQTSYGDAVDTANVNQFVLARESYNWYTIQTNYNYVGLVGSQPVVAAYDKVYNQSTGRQVRLKNGAWITTRVSSIVLDRKEGTATVRFDTQLRRQDGGSDPVKHWIATLSYGYANTPMTAAQRRVNPLGFEVTSYQVDPVVE